MQKSVKTVPASPAEAKKPKPSRLSPVALRPADLKRVAGGVSPDGPKGAW